MFSHETAKPSIRSPKNVLLVKMLNIFVLTQMIKMSHRSNISANKFEKIMLKNQDATKIKLKLDGQISVKCPFCQVDEA